MLSWLCASVEEGVLATGTWYCNILVGDGLAMETVETCINMIYRKLTS